LHVWRGLKPEQFRRSFDEKAKRPARWRDAGKVRVTRGFVGTPGKKGSEDIKAKKT